MRTRHLTCLLVLLTGLMTACGEGDSAAHPGFRIVAGIVGPDGSEPSGEGADALGGSLGLQDPLEIWATSARVVEDELDLPAIEVVVAPRSRDPLSRWCVAHQREEAAFVCGDEILSRGRINGPLSDEILLHRTNEPWTKEEAHAALECLRVAP